mmetsp:Transcript_10031/g.25047  ORF Transcript_10031/g.25047 Transcript_10031/m.25047 type:complete len:81 (-) Transcript_10031:384-626(-)
MSHFWFIKSNEKNNNECHSHSLSNNYNESCCCGRRNASVQKKVVRTRMASREGASAASDVFEEADDTVDDLPTKALEGSI